MEYQCKLSGVPAWKGELEILRLSSNINHVELDVKGRGTQFHVIIGKHEFGRYICIPNHEIGCELASLGDWYWNWEQLCHFLGNVDACTVASGLYELRTIWQ